jgi:cytosine/uracil/thiamine/allantoin permease
MQERLGLPLASVLALFVGVICALAAVGTGLIYTATTVLDWQAVQIWRIEWLLAAIVAFLAGILLKAAGGAKRDPE